MLTEKENQANNRITDSERETGKTMNPKTPVVFSDCPKINIDSKQVNDGIVTLTNEDVLALEQYRSLRTKVLKMAKLPGKNTIMITSSSPGEGKTMTAINLALTIVKGVHQNVLLIDGDLRCPDVHKKLGFDFQYGLSHYLNNQVDLSTVVHRTNIPKLSIIPAGEPISTSSELLASDRMKELIQETKTRYKDRYIIFDVPPIIPVTDASVLVEQVDWAIFVIKAGRTPRETVASAISLFNTDKILGVIMNNIPVMPVEYKHSYKKGSKYGYGYYY
jgi:exopolysaccharide/PEP-CTERM locus tyrosine autokinase